MPKSCFLFLAIMFFSSMILGVPYFVLVPFFSERFLRNGTSSTCATSSSRAFYIRIYFIINNFLEEYFSIFSAFTIAKCSQHKIKFISDIHLRLNFFKKEIEDGNDDDGDEDDVSF